MRKISPARTNVLTNRLLELDQMKVDAVFPEQPAQLVGSAPDEPARPFRLTADLAGLVSSLGRRGPPPVTGWG